MTYPNVGSYTIRQSPEQLPANLRYVKGALVLKFSGTQVGSFETEKGIVHIWSELRSPLKNPIRQGSKGHHSTGLFWLLNLSHLLIKQLWL